jgi:hypothetical protein
MGSDVLRTFTFQNYNICSVLIFQIVFSNKIALFSFTFSRRQSCWLVLGSRGLFLV